MKIITYTSAGGFDGVLSGPQFDGESDADFAARLMALSLPAGATNVQTIDAADYTPPVQHPQPSPREWLERLSSAKQAAVASAVRANDTLFWWFMKASGSPQIDVTNPETVAGVGALVNAGVITSDDEAALLTP